jgi:predicted nucleic acid-binding protein
MRDEAISLATALTAGADLVTLDHRLRRAARSERETE